MPFSKPIITIVSFTICFVWEGSYAQEVPSPVQSPGVSSSQISKGVEEIIGKELQNGKGFFRPTVTFQKNGTITANNQGRKLLGEQDENQCLKTTKPWVAKWTKVSDNTISVETMQGVLIKCVDGFPISPMNYTYTLKGVLALTKSTLPNPPSSQSYLIQLKGICTITRGSVSETREIALELSKTDDVATKPINVSNNNAQSEANDPCKDEVFRRLLNEKYQKEVLDKLKELKPKYALQPLGSRGPTTLNGDGVPNAFISSDLPFANYDRYAITIPASHLPNGFNPELELAKWPNNMNSVPKPGSSGSDTFNSSNVFRPLRTEPILGDLIGIHIPSKPFQAAMILATGSTQDVTVMITDKKPSYFRVSTLESDVRLISGSNARLRHPVSGSREFGFIRNQNGSVTFYTQGLDSPTSDAVNSIGADTQAEGWKGFMSGLGERFGLSPEDAKSSVEKESFTNRSLKNRPNCD